MYITTPKTVFQVVQVQSFTVYLSIVYFPRALPSCMGVNILLNYLAERLQNTRPIHLHVSVSFEERGK